MMTTGERPPVLLQEDNYLEWRRDIRAMLRGIDALGIVDGTHKLAEGAGAAEIEKWRALSNKAASLILRSLSSNQYVFINEEDSASDMWTKLEAAHNKKLPAVRFNAYNELFNIRKSTDETLTSLMTKVENTMARIKSLRPSGYTIEKLDDELAALALLRALPESDSDWTSSLLLGEDITFEKVKTSFATQENLQKSRGEESAAKAQTSPCTFCGGLTHIEETCYAKQNASKAAKEKVKQQHQGSPSNPNKSSSKGKKKKKKETTAATATGPDEEKAEFAGNASTLDDTNPLCALIVEASSDWTADTGASSHMTPHRHWFATYKPHVIPIRLADGKVVMSAGLLGFNQVMLKGIS
jgi:viroplasmin and RNaseH domain-containing protein